MACDHSSWSIWVHCPQTLLSLRKDGEEESGLLNLRRLRSSRNWRLEGPPPPSPIVIGGPFPQAKPLPSPPSPSLFPPPPLALFASSGRGRPRGGASKWLLGPDPHLGVLDKRNNNKLARVAQQNLVMKFFPEISLQFKRESSNCKQKAASLNSWGGLSEIICLLAKGFCRAKFWAKLEGGSSGRSIWRSLRRSVGKVFGLFLLGCSEQKNFRKNFNQEFP